MWDEKEWPKNSDSPTVQKALSIETLKAENAALRERLGRCKGWLSDAIEELEGYYDWDWKFREHYPHQMVKYKAYMGAWDEARAFLASEDQEKT